MGVYRGYWTSGRPCGHRVLNVGHHGARSGKLNPSEGFLVPAPHAWFDVGEVDVDPVLADARVDRCAPVFGVGDENTNQCHLLRIAYSASVTPMKASWQSYLENLEAAGLGDAT